MESLVIESTSTLSLFFADHTAQEYFEHRRRNSIAGKPRLALLKACLAYLSFDVFQRGYCPDYEELKSMRTHNALLDYASRYWGDHARKQVNMDKTTKAMALRFLHDDLKVACVSQVLVVQLHHGYRDYSEDPEKGFSGLHMSAFFGLEKIVICQLEGVNGDNPDSFGRTPLSIAAENGHNAVVKLLLARKDVNVDSKDRNRRTPLSFAASTGSESVVRLLLEKGDIAVNLKNKDGCTPLSFAAQEGSEKVVRLLLARDDIEVNSKGIDGRTSLSYAAERGSEKVVRLLLARDDIEVNSKDAEGRTPLSFAAETGSESVVRLLLAREDVDINSKVTARPPWSFSSFWSKVRAQVGWTPLSFAAQEGSESVVRLPACAG